MSIQSAPASKDRLRVVHENLARGQLNLPVSGDGDLQGFLEQNTGPRIHDAMMMMWTASAIPTVNYQPPLSPVDGRTVMIISIWDQFRDTVDEVKAESLCHTLSNFITHEMKRHVCERIALLAATDPFLRIRRESSDQSTAMRPLVNETCRTEALEMMADAIETEITRVFAGNLPAGSIRSFEDFISTPPRRFTLSFKGWQPVLALTPAEL